MTPAGSEAGLGWLGFALATVVTWGLYGVLLHQGQLSMGDPVNGRYRAFLFVGIAYFLAAVLAPLAMLLVQGAPLSFPAAGIGWSIAAGLAGAAGAFTVLLAFGARGAPSVVMSIVFAGAPIVNALVTLWLKRGTPGQPLNIQWPFLLGIVMAALGGFLVTLYRP
jgi:drug/metabolite transporter (DMT)-like permease